LKQFVFKERGLRSELIIGYVGNLSAQKNTVGLIRAVKKLVDQGFRIKLVLIGAIDEISFDSNILQQHNFIDYKGFVKQDKLVDYYHEMDLFVLNTIQDGFGQVLLQ